MFKGVMFLLNFFWKHEKRYVIYQVLLQILTALVPLMDIVIPRYIVNELIGLGREEVVFGWIGLLMVGNLLGYAVINYLRGRSIVLKGKVFTEFQTMMADKLSRSDFMRLESPHFLDMKEKAEKFLYGNGMGFGTVLESAFSIGGKLFTFVGIVIIVSTLNIWVVMGFVGIILLNTYCESRVRKRIVAWDLEKTPIERRTGYLIDMVENFDFGKEIRIYGLREWIVSKVHKHLQESDNFYKKQVRLSNRTRYITIFTDFLQKGIAYVYLAKKVLERSIAIGDFTMYTAALLNFSNAMTSLMESFLSIQQFSGYYDALMEYMNVPRTMYEGKRLPVPEQTEELRFEDVSFRYPGQENYALRHISIVLQGGEKLSIVGENGAGKTTFVKLLCRLYDPTEGRITLNGVDIRDLDYDQYMQRIGSVFQDYKLLAFSLKENVCFQKAEEEKDDHIRDILTYCGLGRKLDSLPGGVATHIFRIFAEDGFEPSGGEGQKIALARAIYKNAPVMVLDEPTAALDPRAEYEIYQEFSKLTEGKMTIFISHRMSSARFCDHIALFRNGEIVEYGTHEELMRSGTTYKELFEMQAQYYV